jgi:hypothetical protein
VNKAFLREPDEPDDLHCPRCRVLGQAAARDAVAALVSADDLRQLGSAIWFCPNPLCEVGYFDAFEQTVAAARFRRRVYPKNPQAPICPCFCLTADAVEADARAGNPAGVKALIARAAAGPTSCATRTPTGQCCVDEVQRLYLKTAAKRSTA